MSNSGKIFFFGETGRASCFSPFSVSTVKAAFLAGVSSLVSDVGELGSYSPSAFNFLLPAVSIVDFFSGVFPLALAAALRFFSLSGGNSSSETDSVSPRSAGAATGNSSSDTASVSGSFLNKTFQKILFKYKITMIPLPLFIDSVVKEISNNCGQEEDGYLYYKLA